MTLTGQAFLTGAAVLLEGATIPATVTSATRLKFAVLGTGGAGSAGGTVTIQVRNPDGRVSNSRTATQPRILEVPFKYDQHNLSFGNFTDGAPTGERLRIRSGRQRFMSFSTDLRSLGADRSVLRVLQVLKGTGNGGLATGFCTSLASLVADRFSGSGAQTPRRSSSMPSRRCSPASTGNC